MNKKTLDKYRRALERERERLLKNIAEMESNGLLNDKRQLDPSGITTHPADQGTDNFERDLNLGFVTEEHAFLQQVDEALTKIEKEGDYGTCEMCGQAIKENRLTAIPHARHCFSCQQKTEH